MFDHRWMIENIFSSSLNKIFYDRLQVAVLSEVGIHYNLQAYDSDKWFKWYSN